MKDLSQRFLFHIEGSNAKHEQEICESEYNNC